MDYKELLSQLQAQLAAHAQQIESLDEKLLLLLSRNQCNFVKKNYSSSSLLPSGDIISKPKNLGVSCGLKSGGQLGLKRITFTMSTTPNKIIDLKSTFCSNCGWSLQDTNFILKVKQQNIVIPTIKPILEESIGDILKRYFQKCTIVHKIINQQINQSSIVDIEVTSAKCWIWQNLINASDNYGSQSINRVWKDGFPNVTLISDRWGDQLKATVNRHKLCIAHLLRELIFFQDAERQPFAKSFKELIISIFDTQKSIFKAYMSDYIDVITLENRLNELLLISIDKELSQNIVIFQASMIKYHNYLLSCFSNLDIPPDNYGSRKAIRNVKDKQKVFEEFKISQSAFWTIRSIIDTLFKRKLEIMPYLNKIIKLTPVL